MASASPVPAKRSVREEAPDGALRAGPNRRLMRLGAVVVVMHAFSP